MKVAILSDIHSNVFALKAVIKDAKNKGVTKFINLGDTLYGPIEPKKTYKFLKKAKKRDRLDWAYALKYGRSK